MRKILVVILGMICTAASAQQLSKKEANEKWGAVILAIEQIESHGQSNLLSRDGRFAGCLQIAEIGVRQCNVILGYNKFTYKDRFDRAKSHEMFVVFQEHYNPEGNIEKAIRLWNSGDLRCMEHKARTERYYQAVKAKMELMARN